LGTRWAKLRMFTVRTSGVAISGQAVHQGRGAADRSEYRQAAGVFGSK
jgi:hypothetical protein